MTSHDLREYRTNGAERQRAADLESHFSSGARALDVGARDGFFTSILAERFDRVVALDLEKPSISLPGVDSVAGDVAELAFEDRAFDFVHCAEVLEHVPPHQLSRACDELTRVTSGTLLVGVP